MHWHAKLKVFCIKLSKRTNYSRAKKFFDVLQQLKLPGRAWVFYYFNKADSGLLFIES